MGESNVTFMRKPSLVKIALCSVGGAGACAELRIVTTAEELEYFCPKEVYAVTRKQPGVPLMTKLAVRVGVDGNDDEDDDDGRNVNDRGVTVADGLRDEDLQAREVILILTTVATVGCELSAIA